jgi:hypothetical protein
MPRTDEERLAGDAGDTQGSCASSFLAVGDKEPEGTLRDNAGTFWDGPG